MADDLTAAPGSRALKVFIAIVCVVAAVGFGLGMKQTERRIADLPSFVDHGETGRVSGDSKNYREIMASPLDRNTGWHDQIRELSARTTPAADAGMQNPEEGKAESLELRAERRAYAGAPPVIPHPIKERGALDCLACHTEGLTIRGKLAPPMSHERLVNCTQCHVTTVDPIPGSAPPLLLDDVNTFDGTREPFDGEVAWAGAPPTIPHSTMMRTECASCHGLNGRPGIRTSHPWRTSCQQCHAPSAHLNQGPQVDLAPVEGN